jgi:hypothetical protein
VFSGVKPYSITAEKWIQRVENGIATGGWTNAQTIGFVTTALQDSALKWYDALTSRDLDNQVRVVVKNQLLKSYGSQINTKAECKRIS